MMKPEEFASQLLQHTGSELLYRHGIVRDVLYTEGVQFFAKHCGGGAYWLLDILATEPAIRKQAQEFASITFTSKDGKGKIVVTDGGAEPEGEAPKPPAFHRDIGLTTAFDGEWKFFFIGNTIMLAREY